MAKNKYHQRPDGLFETSRTVNGKRIYFRGKTCREVDKKILSWQDERERGRKFPVIADEWETEHEKSVRESTRRVYSFAVKRLKEAFPGYASDIEPLDVQRYIRDFERQGRAGNSVQIELSVCKMIFSHAVMSGDIRVSPAAEVRKSRGLPKKQRRALTETEERAVKDSAATKPPFWLFPYLLLYTGLRRGEALRRPMPTSTERPRPSASIKSSTIPAAAAQSWRIFSRARTERARFRCSLSSPTYCRAIAWGCSFPTGTAAI